MTYKIVRFFEQSNRHITIKRGLTLQEAQQHCSDPETSSLKATSPAARARTRRSGRWFDGYYQEQR